MMTLNDLERRNGRYFLLLYESYTKYKKTGKKKERQTDNQMQSARGQIVHNVRKVTDGERIRQA